MKHVKDKGDSLLFCTRRYAKGLNENSCSFQFSIMERQEKEENCYYFSTPLPSSDLKSEEK
jgi:hypothetical protein